MASERVPAPLITEKLKPTTDESKSAWVMLHDQKQYLLPVMSRTQTITPRFTDTGEVVLETEAADPELLALIESFMDIMTSVEDGAIWFRTAESYSGFFRLVRRLVLTNYEYTAEELTKLLTVSGAQLGVLVEAIFMHLLKR